MNQRLEDVCSIHETLEKVRDEIKDGLIWVSIDEITDKKGRLVGNVVIDLVSE